MGHRSSYLKVTARQPRDEAVDETAEVGAGEGVFAVAQVVDQILGQLGPYPHVRLAHLANEPVQVARLLVRHPALFRRFSATVHTLSSRSTTPHHVGVFAFFPTLAAGGVVTINSLLPGSLLVQCSSSSNRSLRIFHSLSRSVCRISNHGLHFVFSQQITRTQVVLSLTHLSWTDT